MVRAARTQTSIWKLWNTAEPAFYACHTVVSLALSTPSLFQYLAAPLILHPSCFHSVPLHFISPFYHLLHISVISSRAVSWIVIPLGLPSWKQWHMGALVFIVVFLHLVLYHSCFWFSIAAARRCCCYNSCVVLRPKKAETIQTRLKRDIMNFHKHPSKNVNPWAL